MVLPLGRAEFELQPTQARSSGCQALPAGCVSVRLDCGRRLARGPSAEGGRYGGDRLNRVPCLTERPDRSRVDPKRSHDRGDRQGRPSITPSWGSSHESPEGIVEQKPLPPQNTKEFVAGGARVDRRAERRPRASRRPCPDGGSQLDGRRGAGRRLSEAGCLRTLVSM